jgi:hypothetical protein
MSAERVRVEVAFDGGQVIATNVEVADANALEEALGAADRDTYALDADDGHYTIALKRVVWIKRFARESRVGFGA